MNDSEIPLFDLSALDELYELEDEDDKDLVKNLIRDFAQQANHIIDQILLKFAASDSKGVEQLAHSLKSSSRMLGCLRLAKHCEEIEKLSRNDQLVQCAPSIQDLKALCHLSLTELSSAKSSGRPAKPSSL